jgi:N-acyl-D-aspartate/D-glutamate deacylase
MKPVLTALLPLLALWPSSCASQESRRVVQPFDVLILGGRIVDGTGNPWFQGGVAIQGDRIVAVGTGLEAAAARKSIDATGLIVAPGFIDIHSHSDMPLLEDGRGLSKLTQGVTTEVLGEDSSAGPALGKRKEGRLTKAGKTLSWTSLGGYFDVLDREQTAVNLASYAGLGSLLECIKGDALGRPTPHQIEEMKTLLDQAMREGALGLSTMLAAPRELDVTLDDLVALCEVVRKHGGLYSSHIRNEGTGVLEAVREAIAVGERAGIPVDIIHLKIADQTLWGRMHEVLELIDQARERGVDVQANVYPYTRGNNDLVSIIPPWAHEGGKEALLVRLRDKALRPRLKDEIRRGLPGWYNHYTAVGGDWKRMLISGRLGDANRAFQGSTMDQVIAARSAGKDPPPDPLDVLFDLLIEESGSVSTIYAHHTEEDMNMALLQPWCSIGSDGSALAIEGPLRRGHPHPRSFGTFPRVLGVYVRKRKLLRLEDAVRKMTSLNAAKVGLANRGLLRPGQFADITIFDPRTVIDEATYLEPFQYSRGISWVLVNGRVALEKGKPSGTRAGRALRRRT